MPKNTIKTQRLSYGLSCREKPLQYGGLPAHYLTKGMESHE